MDNILSKRKSSNELDRPLPKQRKQAKVTINQQNCSSAEWAFRRLGAGDMQLSKKLVRQKCKQIAKAYDLKLDMRGCAFSVVFDLFKNSGEDLKLFTKSLHVVQQSTNNIIIFSDVYDVSRDKIQTFVAIKTVYLMDVVRT
jgi:hypothetical protein